MKFSNFLKTLVMIPLELVVEILTLIVVPVVLLFCNKDAERLPKLFSWWDEYKYGINGDPYWKGPEHANGKQNTYLWRLKWLFRNRINTFSCAVSGIDMTKCTEISYEGDVFTANKPLLHEGSVLITAKVDGKTYQTKYFIKKWCSRYCLRIYWGWKTKDWAEPGRFAEATESRRFAQFVWYINPFCSFGS